MIDFATTCLFVKRFLTLTLIVFAMNGWGQTVLMFVSQEDTYYSEYIVMKEALEDMGYTVDVRSVTEEPAGCYMVAEESGIVNAANGLAGSSYTAFQAQYENLFGTAWNESLNEVPAEIPVQGSLFDVQNMIPYDALVIPGGTGAQAYLVDGTYEAQGFLTAGDVQIAAEYLNYLANEALMQDKPVLAQCHGAGLPAHWRVPDTSGAGAESLGYSVLKGGYATGFPEAATPVTLEALDITHKTNDRVTVSGVHSSLGANGSGAAKVITTRDWYPQTVAHATQTIINILESYPTVAQRTQTADVLVLHGGAVNPDNCGAANKENDIPCNYGTGENLPADYTHLVALLEATSATDDFQFSVTHIDLSGNSLPFSMTNQAQMETYFATFDAVVFYKHWSNYLTDELQHALVAYADAGGGVVSLHHGLYNDVDNGQNKDILANDLFGAQSAQAGWSANRTDFQLVSTQHGHFITTFGLDALAAVETPGIWFTEAPDATANLSLSYYPAISLFDEVYNNMAFAEVVTFGSGVNEIQPLFSNDLSPAGQAHVAGFARQFNPSLDASEGKVVYLQPGETIANYEVAHPYGQVIRNAVIWAARKEEPSTSEPLGSFAGNHSIKVYPNPVGNILTIQAPTGITAQQISDIHGRALSVQFLSDASSMDVSHLPAGLYFLQMSNGRTVRFVKR